MKIAIVIGGNGLVGAELVRILKDDPSYKWIYRIQRKNNEITDRVTTLTTDFMDLNKLTNFIRRDPDDELKFFCCLGTTMKKAGSKEKFEKVDHQMVIQCARWAQSLKSKHFSVVSAMGASPVSSIYYNRVKGLMERDLKKMGFEQLHIMRPSLLVGNRQERRPFESLAIKVMPFISFLLPDRYKPVPSFAVAQALRLYANEGRKGPVVVENDRLILIPTLKVLQ